MDGAGSPAAGGGLCFRPLRQREFAQRWQIPLLASSGVFDYGGVRGILRCDSLLLEPLPLMRCYSGSFIRAEVRRGRAERVYLDFFPDEQTEAFLRLSEQLEKMLSEQLAEKKRTMH